MTIEIQHQEDRQWYKFDVQNQKSLSQEEVKMICQEMRVFSIFVSGKYYELLENGRSGR